MKAQHLSSSTQVKTNDGYLVATFPTAAEAESYLQGCADTAQIAIESVSDSHREVMDRLRRDLGR